MAAKLQGIPTCIHEQNSISGLANRMIARFADRSFVSIPGKYPFPLQKTMVYGNPVRQEILAAAASKQAKEPGKPCTLLVMGGSLGAHRINLLMLEAIEVIRAKQPVSFKLIHQTGVADEEQVRAAYAAVGIQAEVKAFFQDMATQYAQADLVLARAGATSLAELSVMGLPALLIPYPHAADDHQVQNAKFYVAQGGAEMYREAELNAELLATAIMELLNNTKKMEQMGTTMKKMSQPAAAEQILDECMELIADRI
ncbi:MAG: UDP-N-acetylglucosamine--N-acetylmuramyl-(pentapeptide) pyrophosphoryl-undecaprenol N-acetylglucosamine transferase [Candidatus Electrothrix sp. AR3]|nr:UDP-N-acetylglucosamine--N-acetylmuramyl-(pentapeptide) pyrophosphoryl-undecaprenol N-acetylglucosamine transferase [Candidatus Electrothrix sp. AR3]